MFFVKRLLEKDDEDRSYEEQIKKKKKERSQVGPVSRFERISICIEDMQNASFRGSKGFS